VTLEQKEMKTKLQTERNKKPELSTAVKEEHQKHREQYDVSREPMLNGLTSDFDLKMFRDAQMLACEQLVCHVMLRLYRIGDLYYLVEYSCFERRSHVIGIRHR